MDNSFISLSGNCDPTDRDKLEGELVDAIENEYDALNDETFGIGAEDGDWEEGHDKFAAAVTRKKESLKSELLDTSMFDNDSQNEIVSKSISQLGLEDDLEDPAIMTVGRRRNAWPAELPPRLSPPPPAIIDTELYGSPNAHSIWSTNHSSTPCKDNNSINTLLKSISNSSYQKSPLPSSPVPVDAFMKPIHSKAWTVDEIEKNLIFSGSDVPRNQWASPNHKTSDCSNTPVKNQSFTSDKVDNSSCVNNILVLLGARTVDDIEKDILLMPNAHAVNKVEDVTYTKSELGKTTVLKHDASQPQLQPALFPQMSNVHGIQTSAPYSSPPPTSIRPYVNKNMINSFPVPHSFHGVPHQYHIRNRFGNPNVPFGASERYNTCKGPLLNPLLYPPAVTDPQLMRLPLYSRRPIHHPLLQTGLQRPMWPQLDQNFHHDNMLGRGEKFDKLLTSPDEAEDEYANLMTQSDKERLLRINLMLTNPDNPYVEDYYHTTLMLRQCTQNALKNNKNNECPKLLLPEKSKSEYKTYVPAQFEGSLGKLQAVSVNYPRKVLDITVSRPLEDDEGRVVTNQSLMKYRRLLIDIENLYTCLLEIDNEEKRASALPDKAQEPHNLRISVLILKIFIGLGSENALDDTFQNIMSVRKGRSLGMRAFELFSPVQKLSYLSALFRCLTFVLKKDHNDQILQQYSDTLKAFIKTIKLAELVQLGENLENLPISNVIIVPSIAREKSNFISAFKNKVGSSIVCSLLNHAESIYSNSETIDLEIQAKWAKVVLHIVDILCTLPDTSVAPPSDTNIQLLAHFQRFAIDRDKFEALKEKVKLFELHLCEND